MRLGVRVRIQACLSCLTCRLLRAQARQNFVQLATLHLAALRAQHTWLVRALENTYDATEAFAGARGSPLQLGRVPLLPRVAVAADPLLSACDELMQGVQAMARACLSAWERSEEIAARVTEQQRERRAQLIRLADENVRCVCASHSS